jgi:hypothetical protein
MGGSYDATIPQKLRLDVGINAAIFAIMRYSTWRSGPDRRTKPLELRPHPDTQPLRLPLWVEYPDNYAKMRCSERFYVKLLTVRRIKKGFHKFRVTSQQGYMADGLTPPSFQGGVIADPPSTRMDE